MDRELEHYIWRKGKCVPVITIQDVPSKNDGSLPSMGYM